MTTPTELELVTASRGGDRAAFGELVQRCARMVEAVAYARTRDRTLSEDIAQDAFVAAWRDLHRLRDARTLRPWLCGIARNLAHKARRRRARERPLPATLEPSDDRTPYHALHEDQLDAVLAAALSRVPESAREVLVLFYVEQQSTAAVAAALGVSEDAVHKRLSRGRAQLADAVTAMVEGQLAKRRSRRDVVACVLAALPPVALCASTSEVSAGPAHARSTTRVWAGAAAALVASTLGALAVWPAADASAERHVRVSDTKNPAPAPVSPPRAPVVSRTSSTDVRIPDRRYLAPAPASPSAVVVPRTSSTEVRGSDNEYLAPAPVSRAPSCDSTADRVVAVSVQRFHTVVDRDTLAGIADEVADTCREERWSAAERACIAAATDERALKRCRPDAPAAPRPPAPALVDPDVDVACPVVADHVAQLMIDSLAGTQQDNVAARALVDTDRLPTRVREECARAAWPEPLRRCYAAATRYDQIVACNVAYRR